MADPKFEIVLQAAGGMAQDSSELNPDPNNNGISVFEQGWYRYARNCRIGSTSKNNVGAVENIASTLLNSTYYTWDGAAFVSGSAPAGTNTAIGRREDVGGGKIYWCVHNSNLDHQILMFSKTDNKIYELLKWSGLNFDLQHRVSMAQINNFMGITDYYNPPRIFDLTTIYSLKNTLGSNFSEFHISFLKWAPAPPPFIKVYSTTPVEGTIIPKYYQFAYRLKYKGGFQSTWSPRSNFVNSVYSLRVNAGTFGVAIPAVITQKFVVYVPEFMFDYNDPNNTAFGYSSIKFQSIVESIDFAYREAQDDTWKIFSTLRNPTINYALFDTVQTGPNSTVADSDIGQYYDAIPLLSESIESVDNRFMLSNNLDELPIEEFSVTNVEVYTGTVFTTGIAKDWTNPDSGFTGLPPFNSLGSYLHTKRLSFKERGQYKLGLIYQGYGGRTSLVYTDDTWVYTIPQTGVPPYGNTLQHEAERNHALGFKIPNTVRPAIWATSYQIVRSNCLNIDFFGYGYVNNFRFLVADATAPNNPNVVPQGAQDILNAYYNNKSLVDATKSSADETRHNFRGNNESGVYFPKGYTSIASQLASFARHSVELTGANAVANCSLIYMEITNFTLPTKANLTGTINNPNNNIFYNFEQGDRVRFAASKEPIAGIALSDFTIYDELILYFDGAGIIVAKNPEIITMAQKSQSADIRFFRIEIYRPKKIHQNENVLFYEMGEWYPIIKPTTVDRDFAKRDFTWTSPAAVTQTIVNSFDVYNKMPIANGDVHTFIKDFYYDYYGTLYNGLIDNVLLPQMNPHPYEAFGSWEHNNGRAFVAYKPILNLQQNKPTQIRFGNQYYQDGIFNGLNNFRDEWQHIYPAEYGTIRALVNTSNTEVKAVGNILLAIGEEQTWSIYVNRATIQDLAGHTIVTLSDKVLGSFNTLLGSHGTLNPESVSKNNGRVLFWNAKKGTWVRYSQDGLTRVSREYNMATWFNDLSDLLIGQYGVGNNPKALSVYDNYFDTWLTLIDHSTLPGTYRGYDSYKCAEFNEDFDQWKTIFDYSADLFARLENDVYSINGSTITLHEGGTDFGSFYGVKKDSMIQFVANQQQRKNKVWESIALHATDKWSFPSIKGDYKSNNAVIQESRLFLTDLESLEDVFWSAIKNDKNTPNATDEVDGVVNGNVMRSRALTLMAVLDPSVTWLSVLNYLVVNPIDSPKNVKK